MVNKTKKIKFSLIQKNNDIDWEKWVLELDVYLKEFGYRKYNQKLKREDFSYWKTFDDKYQIGLLIYDFRKHNVIHNYKKLTIQFECILLDIDCRIDLSVSKDIELDLFEEMSEKFYNTMIEYAN